MAQTKIMKQDLQTAIQTQLTDIDQSLSFTPDSTVGKKTTAYTYSSLKDRLNNLETLLSNLDGSDFANAKTFESVSNVIASVSGETYQSIDARLNQMESVANTALTKANDALSDADTAQTTADAAQTTSNEITTTVTNFKNYTEPTAIDATITSYTTTADRFHMIEKLAKSAYGLSSNSNIGSASDRMDFDSASSIYAKLNFVNETESGTFTEIIAYDADENVSSLTVKNGSNQTIAVTNFTYTSGNLTQSVKTLKDTSSGSTYRTITKSYTYDANGNVTQILTATT